MDFNMGPSILNSGDKATSVSLYKTFMHDDGKMFAMGSIAYSRGGCDNDVVKL